MKSLKSRLAVGWYGIALMILLTLARVAVRAQADDKEAPEAAAQSLLVLDPTEKVWSLQVTSNSRLVVKKGGIAVNSTHKGALWVADASVEATVDSIAVVGGITRFGKVSISPEPHTGAVAVSDPYPPFGIPAPPRVVSAQRLMLNDQQQVTLQPGIYTGGIWATAQGLQIFMQPGVYVMNNGDCSLSGAQVTGKDVTIVMGGSQPGRFWPTNGTMLNLAAPTTGPLKGLVLVSRAKGWNMLQINGTQAKLAGTIYAPEAGIGISGKSAIMVNRIVCANLGLTLSSMLEVTGLEPEPKPENPPAPAE